MKLGIGLIILGTIFLCDGTIQLIIAGDFYSDPVFIASAFIKLIISVALLFFGIRRVKRKGQKVRQQ